MNLSEIVEIIKHRPGGKGHNQKRHGRMSEGEFNVLWLDGKKEEELLFGGAFDAAKWPEPVGENITFWRNHYNSVRRRLGLPIVRDWTKKPARLVLQVELKDVKKHLPGGHDQKRHAGADDATLESYMPVAFSGVDDGIEWAKEQFRGAPPEVKAWLKKIPIMELHVAPHDAFRQWMTESYPDMEIPYSVIGIHMPSSGKIGLLWTAHGASGAVWRAMLRSSLWHEVGHLLGTSYVGDEVARHIRFNGDVRSERFAEAFSKYVVNAVKKHLPGQHDQETHGNRGPQFDVNGIGRTPNGVDIDHFGFTVRMKASRFLELADPVGEPRSESMTFLRQALAEGRPFAPPFIKAEWRDGAWKVDSANHEGRHRLMVIIEKYGDIEVPVQVFPAGMRARHITAEMSSAPIRKHLPGQHDQQAHGNRTVLDLSANQRNDLLWRLYTAGKSVGLVGDESFSQFQLRCERGRLRLDDAHEALAMVERAKDEGVKNLGLIPGRGPNLGPDIYDRARQAIDRLEHVGRRPQSQLTRTRDLGNQPGRHRKPVVGMIDRLLARRARLKKAAEIILKHRPGGKGHDQKRHGGRDKWTLGRFETAQDAIAAGFNPREFAPAALAETHPSSDRRRPILWVRGKPYVLKRSRDTKIYNALNEAWNAAHARTPMGPSHTYPDRIARSLREEINRRMPNMFTQTQINSALFSDRFSTKYDSIEYLDDLAGKKINKAAEIIKSWDESAHPRGKTTEASNEGSFAPAALGFATRLFHGTTADIEEFADPLDMQDVKTWSVDRLIGTHMAMDPDVANVFASGQYSTHVLSFNPLESEPDRWISFNAWSGRAQRAGGNVMPLLVRTGPSLNFKNERALLEHFHDTVFKDRPDLAVGWMQRQRKIENPELAVELAKKGKRFYVDYYKDERGDGHSIISASKPKHEGTSGRAWTIAEFVNDHDSQMYGFTPDVKTQAVKHYRAKLTEKGYKSIRYRNDSPNERGARGQVRHSWIVWDQANIRSVNARFDPHYANAAGLMKALAVVQKHYSSNR